MEMETNRKETSAHASAAAHDSDNLHGWIQILRHGTARAGNHLNGACAYAARIRRHIAFQARHYGSIIVQHRVAAEEQVQIKQDSACENGDAKCKNTRGIHGSRCSYSPTPPSMSHLRLLSYSSYLASARRHCQLQAHKFDLRCRKQAWKDGLEFRSARQG
jgi:hypothetical protein